MQGGGVNAVADAGLADERRIVLGAADFLATANGRIRLARAGGRARVRGGGVAGCARLTVQQGSVPPLSQITPLCFVAIVPGLVKNASRLMLLREWILLRSQLRRGGVCALTLPIF